MGYIHLKGNMEARQGHLGLGTKQLEGLSPERQIYVLCIWNLAFTQSDFQLQWSNMLSKWGLWLRQWLLGGSRSWTSDLLVSIPVCHESSQHYTKNSCLCWWNVSQWFHWYSNPATDPSFYLFFLSYSLHVHKGLDILMLFI